MTYTAYPVPRNRWEGRIDGVKGWILDDVDPVPDETARSAAAGIAAVLEASVPTVGDTDEWTAIVEEFRDAQNEREVNEALDRLYDFGDEYRVIIG